MCLFFSLETYNFGLFCLCLNLNVNLGCLLLALQKLLICIIAVCTMRLCQVNSNKYNLRKIQHLPVCMTVFCETQKEAIR